MSFGEKYKRGNRQGDKYGRKKEEIEKIKGKLKLKCKRKCKRANFKQKGSAGSKYCHYIGISLDSKKNHFWVGEGKPWFLDLYAGIDY
jgi:hypothetical protein